MLGFPYFVAPAFSSPAFSASSYLSGVLRQVDGVCQTLACSLGNIYSSLFTTNGRNIHTIYMLNNLENQSFLTKQRQAIASFVHLVSFFLALYQA